MATENRLIDADALLGELADIMREMPEPIDHYDNGYYSGLDRAFEIIEQAPSVQVVRCKDCLYRSQYSDENDVYHCGGIDTTKDHVLPVVSPDFFCAHGERRDDAAM